MSRQYFALLDRLHAWWYPPANESTPYYGYYGHRKLSRLAIAWRRFRSRWHNSRLGLRTSEMRSRLYRWWYLPSEDSGAANAYGGYTPVSRPLRAARRWRRRFQQSWFGREFGWIVDEFLDLAASVQRRIAHDFAWSRVRKWLWRWQTAPILAGLLLVCWFGYHRGLPLYRHYEEAQFSRRARELLSKGDYARALLRARQALAINSKNAEATRVVADMADLANSPFAVYWRERVRLLAPTITNELALASTALKMEPFPFMTAAKTLNEIAIERRSISAYHLIAGALAVKLNNLAEAEQDYATAVQLQPDDPVSQMSLAVVRLQSQNPRMITDARTTLELLSTQGKLGLLPLRSLLAESIARRDFARAEQLSDEVLTNSQAAFGDRILHLAILRVAGSSNFTAYLQEMEQRAAQNPFYAGELANWLNQFGYATETLAWLNRLPTQTREQGLLPLAMADAYAGLKRWKDLVSFLEGAHWSGMEYVRIGMLAFAIRNEAGDQSYATAWQRAIGLASDSPASLNMLAQLAAVWGWNPEAEQVLRSALDRFPKQDWPLAQLKGLYISQKDTRKLRQIFQIELQRHPDDKFAKNNFSILSMLLGDNLEVAHRYAAELYGTDSNNATFTSTYAFSLHLQGDTKRGIEVLRNLKDEDLSKPTTAVYYGVLLAADGQVPAAKNYLAKAATAFLLPEEAALLRSANRAL